MRARKFLTWVFIGFSPLIICFVLPLVDERFINLGNMSVLLALILFEQSRIVIYKDPNFERSVFRAKGKDRRIVYIGEIFSFLAVGLIAFFVAPTYFQALFMVVAAYLLWGGMMYVLGSDDLKDKLRINQSKKDINVSILIGIFMLFILGGVLFFANLTEFQGFLLFFLALGLWYGLMYVFGSDDMKMKIRKGITLKEGGGIFGVINRWIRNDNQPSKE